MATRLLSAHLLGLLVALGFPPYGIWPLTWIAVTFLAWIFLKSAQLCLQANESSEVQKERKALAWTTFFFSTSVNLYGFYWITYTLHEFGALPWVVAGLIYLVAVAVLGLLPWLAGYFWFPFHEKVRSFLPAKYFSAHTSEPSSAPAKLTAMTAGLLGVWWALFEWLDIRFFPWTWAQSVGSDVLLLASVSVLDTWAWSLIFLVFVVSLSFWILRRESFAWRHVGFAAVFSLLFFLPLYGLGYMQKSKLEESHSERQPIALLQGNVGNYEKKLSHLQVAPTIRNVLAIHRDLIEEVAIELEQKRIRNTDSAEKEAWVIWPETSFPGFPMQIISAAEALANFVELTGGLHIVGAYEEGRIDFHGKSKEVDFNIAALYHESRGYVKHYQKHIRVPFGEFVPFDEYLPRAYHWLPNVNHFGKGDELTVLAHPDPEGPVFVPVICYEILFPDFVDAFVQEARKDYPGRPIVIVNPTNDSWYGPTSEPWTHSLLSRWAAARVGLPLLRPTNTGLSQIVAPWGEVMAVGPRDTQWTVFGELPVQKAQLRMERSESP